ncbi:hypothetical protein [Legionella cincinnatiensis]|uniref:Uncharacterized protein n=1 Tax=Legionella cincinnatiensis TaxID=28085 RepID=A0A378IH32_9GAMM|nr:hypothetical protein [Legionella cincinnatiensis]KTC83532.1 hypothetical protein Lcin_2219 [Legionella cincinnatiensis]STX34509.1 Uncharacterised protein [Legionella cincinnatiensis]
MSRFPNKTHHELCQYFKKLSLDQLKKENHAYGAHFENLENKIDECNRALVVECQHRHSLQEQKSNYELTYDSVVLSEQEYRLSLESLNDITDHSERFLARKSIGISPMEVYNQKLSYLITSVQQSHLRIEHLTKRCEDLTKKKSGAISELKILNSIIQEKEQLISAPQIVRGYSK